MSKTKEMWKTDFLGKTATKMSQHGTICWRLVICFLAPYLTRIWQDAQSHTPPYNYE